MLLPFTKMHGIGNDYIYFNCFETKIDDPERLAIKLSDRHFSIGGDGIVLICPSDAADAKMRMFNIDGSEGKMCGNAIRCVGKFIFDSGIAKKETVKIETLSGIKTLKLQIENGVCAGATVDMENAVLNPKDIPTALCPGAEKAVNTPLTVDGKTYFVTCVSMGNPHCVVFTDEKVEDLNLQELGPKFEHSPAFPDRVNTEFVNILDKNHLRMRVWERGSGETLACGTGACATAVAAVLNGISPMNEDISVLLNGGTLTIKYTGQTVYMTGPAAVAFRGTVEI